MKNGKWILKLTIVMLAVLSVLFCACVKKDITPAEGAETGVYYMDTQSGEWTIGLYGGNKVKFTFDTETEGTYTVDGETVNMNVADVAYAATLTKNVLTFIYEGKTVNFYKKINYTVTYMTGNSVFTTQTVVNGKAVSFPATPTSDGKIFVGWYIDKDMTVAYVQQPVCGNFTLYARFVDSIDPEFIVKYDYNYDGAPSPAETTTAGGKLYSLPSPERAGYAFAGWWTSMFDSAAKLSARYEVEQPLFENTTLYAVWKNDNTPLVSIYENGIKWEADGEGNNYALKIYGPNERLVMEQSVNDIAFFGYDFANEPAGEYRAEITLNGKTGKAYLNNNGKPIDFSSMTYVAIGDSITAGADTDRGYRPMDYPYPELVKEELGLGKVINYGANGTYLTDFKGNGTAISVRYKDMEDAQIVSVLGGINDFCAGDGKQTSIALGNIDDTDIKTIYGALNILAKGLKEKYPHAFIFFMTPMPVTAIHYPPTISYELTDLVQAIKDVANKFDIAVLDLYNDCPYEKEMYKDYSDGIHPTQEFVKSELAPLISKFIKSNYKAI